MKNFMTIRFYLLLAVLSPFVFVSCSTTDKVETNTNTESVEATTESGGQASVVDNVSSKDVVKVAMSSPDHTTLVAAVKAADLVNSLSNAGPFTVFAPTNAAFDALPKGTVDELLKPENVDKLSDILQYHVTLSAFELDDFTDGQNLGEVNGGSVVIHVKDGKVMVNDANIIGTVKASNGVVHVIDKVLLPK